MTYLTHYYFQMRGQKVKVDEEGGGVDGSTTGTELAEGEGEGDVVQGVEEDVHDLTTMLLHQYLINTPCHMSDTSWIIIHFLYCGLSLTILTTIT